jgi:hypothetical protein
MTGSPGDEKSLKVVMAAGKPIIATTALLLPFSFVSEVLKCLLHLSSAFGDK